MKKLITLALCTGVFIISIWSYNSNVQSAKITSYETQKEIDALKFEKGKQLLKSIQEEKRKEVINNKIIQAQIQVQKEIPLYDIPLNIDIQKYIYKISKEKNIPHELILGVIKTESDFRPNQTHKNKNGSIDIGLMQVNSCHVDICKELGITNLYDPYQNIKIGATLLANIYNSYPNIHKAMMVYNMGLGGARRNWKVGRSSTDYSRKVVNNINIILACKQE